MRTSTVDTTSVRFLDTLSADTSTGRMYVNDQGISVSVLTIRRTKLCQKLLAFFFAEWRERQEGRRQQQAYDERDQ
jgi:hypothetical protein